MFSAEAGPRMARGLHSTHPMEPRILKIALVAMVILAVVSLSLFPKEHGTGSYQSVNGPTTVFQGFRAALLLVLILLGAGMAAMEYPASATDVVRTNDRSGRSGPMRQ
jgi:hypothetical protein